MKRGARMYLVDIDGKTAGPFPWTLVREWVALSLLSSNSSVFLERDNGWQTVADFPELSQFPKSVTNKEVPPGSYLSDTRLKLPSLSCQHSYAKMLGCPFAPDQIDRHLLAHIIWSLQYAFPDRVDTAFADQVADASDWHNDPATESQISGLRSIGVRIEDGLTKGRACQLIGGEPTEGQLRRLKFYRITPSPYLTKEEASELIDGYLAEHPESEEQYQAWKQRGCPVQESVAGNSHSGRERAGSDGPVSSHAQLDQETTNSGYLRSPDPLLELVTPMADANAELESYRKRLEELAPQVRQFVPDWSPTHFDDAISYMCYVSVI